MKPMHWGMVRRAATAVGLTALMLLQPPGASATTLYTLTGHGYGHGIGMSQWGAYGYATHGWTYEQILGHYFTGTSIAPVSQGAIERVLLTTNPTIDVESAAKVTVRNEATTTSTSLPAGSYRVALASGKMEVVNRATGNPVLSGMTGPLDVTPSSGYLQLDNSAGIGFAGDHWRGWFRIVPTGSTLECIDQVVMERYVAGVVPNEVPASWPTAALRAQAVAARTYAYATRHPTQDFDAYADTRSQVFGPIEREQTATTAAVTATNAQVVTYNGAVATTLYSSSSGGRTSSEQASWGSASGEPYLVPVNDLYDAAGGLNPNHTWTPKVYTTTGLAALFGFGGGVGGIDQTWDLASLREQSLTLHTGAGDHPTPAWTCNRGSAWSNYFRTSRSPSAPAVRRWRRGPGSGSAAACGRGRPRR